MILLKTIWKKIWLYVVAFFTGIATMLFFVLRPDNNNDFNNHVKDIETQAKELGLTKEKFKEKAAEQGKTVSELENDLDELYNNGSNMKLDEAIEYLKGMANE